MDERQDERRATTKYIVEAQMNDEDMDEFE
jgi:hypothetical protein